MAAKKYAENVEKALAEARARRAGRAATDGLKTIAFAAPAVLDLAVVRYLTDLNEMREAAGKDRLKKQELLSYGVTRLVEMKLADVLKDIP